jgi:hypothetical protein
MNIVLDNAILKLDQRRDLSIREADGDCIHDHWGRVRVTRGGDTRDHVIDGGEPLAIDSPGTTVLTAMSDAGIPVMKRHTSANTKIVQPAAVQGSSEVDATAWAPVFDRTYPEYRDVDRTIHRVHRHRAQTVAGGLRNMWAALRGALAAFANRGARLS